MSLLLPVQTRAPLSKPLALLRTLLLLLGGALLLHGSARAQDPALTLTLRGKTSHAFGVAFHPDGKTLIAGGSPAGQDPAGVVEVFDAQTGGVVAALDHPHGVAAVSYALGGARIVAVGSGEVDGKPNGVLRTWEVATRKQSVSLVRDEPFGPVVVGPDGKSVALARRDAKLGPVVDLLGVADLRVAEPLAVGLREITALAFARDGKTLLVGGRGREAKEGTPDGRVEVWDVAARKLTRTVDALPFVTALAFQPDGERFAVGWNGPVQFVDVKSGKTSDVPAVTHSRALAFSPDGTLLACANGERVRLIEVKSGTVTATLKPRREVCSLAFSPDGRRLAVGAGVDPATAKDAAVYVWDVGTGRDSSAWEHHGDYRGLAFGPDDKTLLAYCNYSAVPRRGLLIETWDLGTRSRVPAPDPKTPRTGGEVWASRLAFGPDGKTVAVGGRLFDPAAVRQPVNLALPGIDEDGKLDAARSRTPFALSFSPNGKLIAGTAGGVVGFWDAATLKPITAKASAVESVSGRSVVFGPDNRTVAVGTVRTDEKDASVELWDATTGNMTAPLKGATATRSGLALAFSPNGKTLAVGGEKAGVESRAWIIELWDVEGKKLLTTLDSPGPVLSATYSPDGTLLAAACGQTLVIWDAKTRAIRVRVGHNEQVSAVAFSRDGSRIATASSNPGLRLWVVKELLAPKDGK